MTLHNAYTELEKITVGHTRIISQQVVTRWASDVYEVGTWGKATCDVHKAADTISADGN